MLKEAVLSGWNGERDFTVRLFSSLFGKEHQQQRQEKKKKGNEEEEETEDRRRRAE
jgi:hypothetical protein